MFDDTCTTLFDDVRLAERLSEPSFEPRPYLLHDDVETSPLFDDLFSISCAIGAMPQSEPEDPIARNVSVGEVADADRGNLANGAVPELRRIALIKIDKTSYCPAILFAKCAVDPCLSSQMRAAFLRKDVALLSGAICAERSEFPSLENLFREKEFPKFRLLALYCGNVSRFFDVVIRISFGSNLFLSEQAVGNSACPGGSQKAGKSTNKCLRWPMSGNELNMIDEREFATAERVLCSAEDKSVAQSGTIECEQDQTVLKVLGSRARVIEFYRSLHASKPQEYMIIDGLIKLVSGRREPVTICTPIRVVRLVRAGKTSLAEYVIEYIDHDEIVHEVSIRASDIGRSSPDGIKVLRDAGIQIFARDGLIADYIRASIYPVVDPVEVQPGWFSDPVMGFGLASGEYLVGDAESSTLVTAVPRHHVNHLALIEWQERVGAKLRGNHLAMFSVCIALTGPLLPRMSWQGGIFNCALKTSTAKTSALMIANHVWTLEVPHGWEISRASSDDACLAANGTFIALDEMPDEKLKKVEAKVFAICNGVRRGARPAPGRDEEGTTWNLMGASTSEYPLYELAGMAEKGTVTSPQSKRLKEGLFVRLVDIGGRDEILWNDLHGAATMGEFLRSLAVASAATAGVVGPAFVQAVLNSPSILSADLAARHVQMMNTVALELGVDPSSDDGQVMRVAGHVAAVWIAGSLAVELGILPWSAEDVRVAVFKAAHSWAKIRKIGTYAVSDDPVDILRKFLLPRLGKELREVGPDRRPLGKMAYAPRGWFNDEHYYLRSETLRELVAPKATTSTDLKGLVHDLCLELEARGALVRGGARDCMMVRMADCIESGRRVYMLRRAVIDEAPEDW